MRLHQITINEFFFGLLFHNDSYELASNFNNQEVDPLQVNPLIESQSQFHSMDMTDDQRLRDNIF